MIVRAPHASRCDGGDVGRETRLERQLEEGVLRGHWHRSLSGVIMQRSLINTCAYLLVIKISN